jgi:geranylgeranyl diphosphate synthase type II
LRLAKPTTDRTGLSSDKTELVCRVLSDSAEQTERALRRYLQDLVDVPARLVEAMGYSLFAGGKRVRPGLVFATGRLFGAPDERLAPPAAAMECVHTFSLIHDDLPAMDDDDLRRGRPTNHKVYGEAMAILAGDALLSFAFEILTNHVVDTVLAAAMVRELATATGPTGMIGGQVADMEGEHQDVSEANVRYVHERKTAALIAASCKLGALAAGAADADVRAVGRFGYHLGLAFQLADDALDATATAEQLGKRAGKDTQAGKQTMVRLSGVEATMQAARGQVERALACLDPYGESAGPLRGLAEFVIQRSS